MAKSENTIISNETMSFNVDLKWLNNAFERVKKSFDGQRLPHALLITAPAQSGKGLLATHLAQSMLCSTTNQSLSHACGQCKSCLLIKSHSHPDLSQVDCLIDNKGKVKKSIGIDQIRLLSNKLTETPQYSGWRIAIIMSVEKMTRGSFNAILKTLEEPGEKTLILMLANSLHQVPATIKSRCQLLHLDLKQNELLPWLVNVSRSSEAESLNALNQCHLAPFAALNYIKQNKSNQYKELQLDLDNVLQTNLTPQGFISRYFELDEQLWVQMVSYFQKVQIAILNRNEADTPLNLDLLSLYKKMPQTLPSKLYSELIEYSRGQSAGSNLQVKLQLESILIQWFEIGRKIVHHSNR